MAEESLKNKTIKGVAWNTINSLLASGTNFIVGIVLARLLMPADFGAISMVLVFTTVLAIFSDGGGLTQALVRKENRTEADKATVFIYNVVACYIIYAVIFFTAPLIAKFYDMPELCALTRVVSLTLLISPFAGIQRMHLTTNIDFKRLTIVGSTGSIISGIVAIMLAFYGWGVYALAFQQILTTLISTILLIYFVRWWPKVGFSWASFKELFGFSSRLLVAELLERVYTNITPLIVGKFFSPIQLGFYEQGKRWPQLISQNYTNVLQGVTYPVLSKMQGDLSRLRVNYRRILRMSAFVSFPIMVCLAACAKPIILLLVTEKWADSIILLQLVCFSAMWYPIHSINLNLLKVVGRSDYFLKLEVAKKIWSLLVMCCALPFGLVAFCAAGILSSYVALFINTWYSKKIIGYGYREQLKDMLPILFNSIVMGILCWLVQIPFDPLIVKLFVALPVALCYYIISSRFLHKEEFNEVLSILSSQFRKK